MDYITPVVGGALIGLGSLIAMAASGKIPGISGITAKILRWKSGDTAWRIVFLLGLVAGGGLAFAFKLGWQEFSLPGGRGTLAVVIAGFLVGFGTRMGGGCTSGHGVCGIGAGAKDGFIYTLVFMIAGIMTVLAWNLITSGGSSL